MWFSYLLKNGQFKSVKDTFVFGCVCCMISKTDGISSLQSFVMNFSLKEWQQINHIDKRKLEILMSVLIIISK